MPFRRAALAAAAAVLAVPAVASASTVDEINALRVEHQLPALTAVDAAAAQLEDRMLSGETYDADAVREREDGDDEGYDDCLCRLTASGDDPADAEDVYAASQPGAAAAFQLWLSGRTLTENLSRHPRAAAALLDPRATTLTVGERDGLQAVAVTVDPQAAWTQPIVVSSTPFALDGQPLLVLTGPGHASAFTLLVRRDGRTLAARTYSAGSRYRRGVAGQRLYRLGAGEQSPVFGYDVSYRLTSGSWATSFAGERMPGSDRVRSFRFRSSMTARLRRQFRAAIAAGNPQARRWLGDWDGLITVRSHHGGGYSYASVTGSGGRTIYELDLNADHLAGAPAWRNHVVWHELGHIVDFSGLRGKADAKFSSLFRRSGRYRSCFSASDETGRKMCVSSMEVFADQFAFFATGNGDVRSGYGVPPLASARSFGRLLSGTYVGQPAGFSLFSVDGETSPLRTGDRVRDSFGVDAG